MNIILSQLFLVCNVHTCIERSLGLFLFRLEKINVPFQIVLFLNVKEKVHRISFIKIIHFYYDTTLWWWWWTTATLYRHSVNAWKCVYELKLHFVTNEWIITMKNLTWYNPIKICWRAFNDIEDEYFNEWMEEWSAKLVLDAKQHLTKIGQFRKILFVKRQSKLWIYL